MSLEKIIKDNLPALPELVSLLRDKFSVPTLKTYISEDGELFYEGNLAIGTDVFAKTIDECILKNTEKGMSKTEAKEKCESSGDYSKVLAASKTYKHKDGTQIVVESGKIVDIINPTASSPVVNAEQLANELFKSFPKTDLSSIELALAELKATIAEIQKQKAELSAKVTKFGEFKDEVIGILEKFSKSASTAPLTTKKTSSAKSLFNSDLTFEERILILQQQQQ